MAVSKGEMTKQKSIAANMLAKGMATELIEELTGLTEDEITKLISG